MPVRRLATALLVLAAAACSAPSFPDESPPSVPPVTLTRFRTEPFAFRFNSGFAQPVRLVVRDAGAWAQAWATAWQGTTPVPPLPAVDFTREAVLVAALGERASGGYGIVIRSAVSSGAEVVVTVRSTSPGAGCMATAALTQPVDFARMPATSLAVRFGEESAVVDCP